MVDQQLAEEQGRAIKVPSSEGAQTEIVVAGKAGYYLRRNVAGTAFELAVGDANTSTFTQSGTGAVERSVTAKLGEVVSVKDFGAVGDGATDDTTAIQAAIDYIATVGGTVFFPAGAYLLTASLTVDDNNVRLLGEGPKLSYFTKSDAASFKYLKVGVLQDVAGWVTTEANTLASNATYGDLTIALAAGKGANFTAGTWAVLINDGALPGGTTNLIGEFVYIFSKSTDTLTLGGPLSYSHTTANNAELRNIVNFIEGFEINGIGFDGATYAHTGSEQNGNMIEAEWLLEPKFKNLRMWEMANVGLQLQQCVHAEVDDISFFDGKSTSFQGFIDGFSYGVAELGLNLGASITNLQSDNIRHTYSTADSPLGYGVPTGSVIGDSTATNCRGAGFDTHAAGSDITFSNCSVVGSLHHGFQARCVRQKMIGCSARDCAGAGVNVASDAVNTMIKDFSCIKTNTSSPLSTAWVDRGAIYDDAVGTIVDGALLQNCGGPGITSGASMENGRYSNVIIRDAAQDTSTEFYGVKINTAGPTTVRLDNVVVEDTANLLKSFVIDASTLVSVNMKDCEGPGYSPIPFEPYILEDFIGQQDAGLLPPTLNAFEGSEAAVQWNYLNATESGQLRMTSAATNVSFAADGICLVGSTQWLPTEGRLVFEARMNLTNVGLVSAFIGFTDRPNALEMPIESAASADTITTTATDAVGFMFDTRMSTDNWWLVGVANDVDATTQNSALAPTGNLMVTLRVEVSTAGVATFYIDGTKIGTVMAAAVTPSVYLCPVFALRSVTTANRSLDIDYLYVQQRRKT